MTTFEYSRFDRSGFKTEVTHPCLLLKPFNSIGCTAVFPRVLGNPTARKKYDSTISNEYCSIRSIKGAQSLAILPAVRVKFDIKTS